MLLAATAWVFAKPKSAAPRNFLLTIALTYSVLSIYPIPHAVERWIAAPFHQLTPADVPSGPSAVVLLGSGGYRREDWSGKRMSALDSIGMERTLEAARVYHLVHPEWIISSGGLIDPDEPEDPSGETMKDALVRLGVPSDRIVVERESTNTRDEATFIARLLPSLGSPKVILVTSAIHMRRAVGMFRAVGIEPIPAIAHERQYDDVTLAFMPSDLGLRQSSLDVHEIAGLVYYRLKGWYK